MEEEEQDIDKSRQSQEELDSVNAYEAPDDFVGDLVLQRGIELTIV